MIRNTIPIPPAPAIVFDGDRWLTPGQLASEQRRFDAATWRGNAVALLLLGPSGLALVTALIWAVLQ